MRTRSLVSHARLRRGQLRVTLGATAIAAALAPTSTARAQVDVSPAIPNVLLLIDTSGSMENMVNGNRPENESAACTPGVAMAANKKNRWATLVSVLTGTIPSFSCHAVDRSSMAFKTEYTYDGAQPYDAGYYLPFHRPISNGCTARPGVALPGTWFEWPIGGVRYHKWNNPLVPCVWESEPNGVLDTFVDRARFGLMTFDPLPDAGTGATGPSVDGDTGMAGMWSYYRDWQTNAANAHEGNPAGCCENPPSDCASEFDVGARNPAAPPWEGRLISFGTGDAALVDIQTTNARIQEAVLAMRPFGATPLAGMMEDARDFLLYDELQHPLLPAVKLGPAADPFRDCRDTVVIVLSDGEPNLDMRPSCDATDPTYNGQCPYEEPWTTANELFDDHAIKTYAIGFGLGEVNGVDCDDITQNDYTDQVNGRCHTTPELKACCTLARLSFEGGGRSYFTTDEDSLRKALVDILSREGASSTSRTVPVFASGTSTGTALVGSDALASGYQFLASFNAPTAGKLWTGNLERRRYVCEQDGALLNQPVLDDFDPAIGDDFEANLNAGSPTRRLFTIEGESIGGAVHSQRSIRPVISDDGIGGYQPRPGTGVLQDPVIFSNGVDPLALGIALATPPAGCVRLGAALDGDTCADRLLRWNVGESNAPTLPETRAGALLGSIYHSTPVIHGTPRDFLRDESYSKFAEVDAAKRPLVLYTATTDGQLHAFKVAPNDPTDNLKVDEKVNNELWSFIPPYVLPRLLSAYDQQAILLDGAPVVKDVVFERRKAEAIAGSASGRAQWRTVLLAGGGPAGGFYYALDVTDPVNPTFLWQLSEDADGNRLFGDTTPTPAIATITLEDQTGLPMEVAVAILPGGSAKVKTGVCNRETGDLSEFSAGAYDARPAVRCWGDPATPITEPVGSARSLMVVRLDNGQVLMSFRGEVDDGPAGVGSSIPIKDTTFDSPMTGIPVPYPSQTGQVANRIFIGDSDGSLWRIDISSTDPAEWDASLFWDAFPMGVGSGTDSQPIQTTPVVSVDPSGKVVVLFSTGDQELLAYSALMKNRVWSITETPTAGKFPGVANWFIDLEGGKRVTGPLSLFNSIAYFATYTPGNAVTNACDPGFGSVWGVHYLKSCADDAADAFCTGGDVDTLPLPMHDHDEDQGSPPVREDAQDAGTVVFGVGVTQVPSCVVEDVFPDPYLGDHSAVSSVTPGEFKLVFQTGQGGTKEDPNLQTNTTTQTLPRPRESTRIDSWASLLE